MSNGIICPEELQDVIRQTAEAIKENERIGKQLELVYRGLLELVEPKEARFGGI